MGRINPERLNGIWTEGFVLDRHIIKSEFLGLDEQGREQFDTVRTELGQLVYELKYRWNEAKVIEVIELISPFLNSWKIANKIDVILPVPPSNKTRKYQPVFEICRQIGQYLNKKVYFDVLEKTTSTQSKNLATVNKLNLSGSISKGKTAKRPVNVLLVDDLYESGKTLTESVKVLRTDPKIKEIYVLVMTKTRR